MPTPDVLLGQRIRNYRESAGMSQADLSRALEARGLNIPSTTVYKIEHATRKVLASELPIFGAALGVPAANLLGLGEDRAPLHDAGGRLEEASRNLETASLAYARAMLSFALAADAMRELHENDEYFVTESLIRQTPGWVATANVIGSIDASLKLNRREVTSPHARAVLDALKREHDHFHEDADG
ncbi:helix-turn-helix domain-containing protein [Microbacterium sp. SORGH_AS_0888]|uniref:helix-turn-helix domain-containing protein n=1 Tax=Microbacterium sp. SORGH_AS_0888 TaxID=3041791 RepID=UPI0027D7DF53|nr:helix-turn-helix transcriptional regulator [Microbacterium sp. SORGH_AS_0888]